MHSWAVDSGLRLDDRPGGLLSDANAGRGGGRKKRSLASARAPVMMKRLSACVIMMRPFAQ
jgi:hypothetical protein